MEKRTLGNSPDFRVETPVERRLTEAVWSLWETGGHAAISARVLAQQAGIPISTLYNRFPSMEQVFAKAQEEALIEARRWCALQMEHLSSPANPMLPGAGLGTIMAALIDEWTQGQRRLAFAWREGFLLARRDPQQNHPGAGWRTLWSDFWQEICALCGMGQHGEWTSFVFEAEAALHMLPWRRVLDRACLEELCEGWAVWLDGRLVADGPWREVAREQALASLPDMPIHDGVTRQIAAAAADVVEQQGMARLTHRSVAAAAGVSLGMVSSRFRTSVDLVRAAFEAIYQRAAHPGGTESEEPTGQSLEDLIARLTGQHMSISRRLAFEELTLAVARDPDFQPFGPQLRYLRGRTSGQILQKIAGPAIILSRLDAGLFSNLLSGMQRAGIELSPSSRADTGRSHITRLLHLLNLPAPSTGESEG
jgi:AcrR family transcriptional regulator